jgi:outer membrane murein-binding lipoprotein Lpp
VLKLGADAKRYRDAEDRIDKLTAEVSTLKDRIATLADELAAARAAGRGGSDREDDDGAGIFSR